MFDGHGGSFVSRFVAENFMTVFNNSWAKIILKKLNIDAYSKNIKRKVSIEKIDFEEKTTITLNGLEQILIQTFLDFDELLQTIECEKLVHEYKTFKRNDLILNNITRILSDESK